MTAQTTTCVHPSCAAVRRKQQLRRRYELLNFIFEGLTTLGIGACFIFSAILFLCII